MLLLITHADSAVMSFMLGSSLVSDIGVCTGTHPETLSKLTNIYFFKTLASTYGHISQGTENPSYLQDKLPLTLRENAPLELVG